MSTMRIYTVTCDGRPAAVVRAAAKAEAIAITLDLAEQRNLLGLVAGPRRFDARAPADAEMARWSRCEIDHLIHDAPIAT
jgi:hypothetical protein